FDRTNAILYESNLELASANKELAATNIRFAETNKRFAQVNEELSATNKELADVIDKLALANEQIREREGAQKDFVNIAAHELRTPTQSILGYTELLKIIYEQEEQETSEHDSKKINIESKKALDAIFRNAVRLDKLANDILDVTKIESNILNLNKKRFNLSQKIRDVISDVTTNEMRKDHHVKNINIILVSKEPNDIYIEADQTRIYQVISNLLRNAIKFTEEGGSITITVETSADKELGLNGEEKIAVVKIKDTGSGLDDNILPKLFSKFTTSSSEGTGLGLFISKAIIDSHGGKIWAENNNNRLEGQKGATFGFSLPCFDKLKV
ncbi:MAG TPA: HAMP domain-containing sensor histidine kinase, partial [Nitrososphaeraceae archaeon]|nr:HAMP domain-containing sensor histidine kinase [Nitrososphaeraceae archaeon]